MKLFMVLLGCKPAGRNIEQHDLFFGIAESLAALVPSMKAFWPEAKSALHIDAWREVTAIGEYGIKIKRRAENAQLIDHKKFLQLFFINLGGYKKAEFEEFHYKMLIVAESTEQAKATAKAAAFYKHTGFKGATSHIDDKYGVDIDELFGVEDVLDASLREQFTIEIIANSSTHTDTIHIGYLPLSKISK